MAHQRDDRQPGPGAGPMAPDADGKTAGSNTQSQGGIGPGVARAAHGQADPAAGLPGGLPRVDPPGRSPDPGGRARGHRTEGGFSGDDGGHVPGGGAGAPASLQPGPVADLGAQQDARTHGLPRDPADRTTGADSPNRGGTAGSPGGPSRTAPDHLPGQEPDEGVRQGGQSGNDAQRDPQV